MYEEIMYEEISERDMELDEYFYEVDLQLKGYEQIRVMEEILKARRSNQIGTIYDLKRQIRAKRNIQMLSPQEYDELFYPLLQPVPIPMVQP